MVIRHIRYLNSNATVCHEPERLGSELVLQTPVNALGTTPCRECGILLVQHNAKQVEMPLARDLDEYNRDTRIMIDGDNGSGFVAGAFVASIAWLIVIAAMFLVVWS